MSSSNERNALLQIRERAFRLARINCPDDCSEWTHPLCWIARAADAALRAAPMPASPPETECEPDAWMAEDGRVCTADLKRSQKPIMTAGFTIPLYRRAVKSDCDLTISKEPQ